MLSMSDEWVESCMPNPCQFGGKCINNGTKQLCQCKGHYTGRFCGLSFCEFEPCVFGQCELTINSFKVFCHIFMNYYFRKQKNNGFIFNYFARNILDFPRSHFKKTL